MINEVDTIKRLYKVLNSKNSISFEDLILIYRECDETTDNTINLFNANLAKIKKIEANRAFKGAEKLVSSSILTTIKTRTINNLKIVIQKNVITDFKYITITNLKNDYTIKGRGVRCSDLELLKDIYKDRNQVKRDITLFYKLGDEINVFESYTSGLLFALTKINSKSVVFSRGALEIKIARYVPTSKMKDSGKLHCQINKIESNGFFKQAIDIRAADKSFTHVRKYLLPDPV